MLNNLIPLIGSFLKVSFMEYWFFPMIVLAFLATFPGIVRQIFLGGR